MGGKDKKSGEPPSHSTNGLFVTSFAWNTYEPLVELLLSSPDRVLYARKGGEEAEVAGGTALAGEKISVDDAIVSSPWPPHPQYSLLPQLLKTVCWGGPNIVPRPDWIKTGFVFNPPDICNAYGLKAVKGATKAFQLVLEAYILKQLLFEGKNNKKMAK